VFLLVEPPRPSLPFDPVFLVPALPPVLTRPIGRSLPYGPHQHHHRALNPILGFSNDPGRDGFDTSAVTAAELLRENNSTTSGIVFARVALEVESASRNTLADRSGPIETYCSSTVSSNAAVAAIKPPAGTECAATAAVSRIGEPQKTPDALGNRALQRLFVPPRARIGQSGWRRNAISPRSPVSGN